MVRFTDAEYASISISAEQAGYPVAVYVRKSALDERIEVHYNITAELPELQKLIAEYSAIGNNLNQIAQYFHSGGFYSKSIADQIDCDPCLDKILEEHPCIYIMQVVSLGQHRDQLIAEYQSDDDSGNRNYHRL